MYIKLEHCKIKNQTGKNNSVCMLALEPARPQVTTRTKMPDFRKYSGCGNKVVYSYLWIYSLLDGRNKLHDSGDVACQNFDSHLTYF